MQTMLAGNCCPGDPNLNEAGTDHFREARFRFCGFGHEL